MRQADLESTRNVVPPVQAGLAHAASGAGWDRAQRALLAGLGVLGTVGLLGLAGCPASLEDPGRFDQDPAAGGGMGMTSPALAVPTTCLEAVFKKNTCLLVGCHASKSPAAGLDLQAAGVNARLVNIVATHGDATMPEACPKGDKLIDTATPANSWLLKKLTKADEVMCGAKMPIGNTLSPDDMACVQKYVTDVAAASGGM